MLAPNERITRMDSSSIAHFIENLHLAPEHISCLDNLLDNCNCLFNFTGGYVKLFEKNTVVSKTYAILYLHLRS